MHSSIFFPSSLLIFLFLISITFFPRNVSSNICAPFDCGDIKGITYPFRENKQPEHCGHPGLVLDCKKDKNLVINIMSQKFEIIGIDQNAQILKLVREDFKDDICPKQFSNISIDFSLFNYTPNNQNVTLLYDCDPVPVFPPNLKFSCPIKKVPRKGYVLLPDLGSEFPWPPWPCGKNLLVPVLKSAFEGLISEHLDVDEVLEEGFEVRWIVEEERHCQDCVGSGGMCGYNFTVKEFNCFCSDQAHRLRCSVNSSPELAPAATASVIDIPPALTPGNFTKGACTDLTRSALECKQANVRAHK